MMRFENNKKYHNNGEEDSIKRMLQMKDVSKINVQSPSEQIDNEAAKTEAKLSDKINTKQRFSKPCCFSQLLKNSKIL